MPYNKEGPLKYPLLQGEDCIQKDCAFVFHYILTSGVIENIERFISFDTIPALSSLLASQDPEIVTITLEGMISAFQTLEHNDADCNKVLEEIRECGGYDRLKELSNSNDLATGAFARNILNVF